MRMAVVLGVTLHWFNEVLLAADLYEAVLSTDKQQQTTTNTSHLWMLRLEQPATHAASLPPYFCLLSLFGFQ